MKNICPFWYDLKNLKNKISITINPHSVYHGVLESNPGEDRLE